MLVFQAWVSSSQNWSSNPSFQLLWLVSWVSMVWSFQSFFNQRVRVILNWLDLILMIVGVDGYNYASGYKHLASGLVCGLSSLVIHYFPNNFRLQDCVLVLWVTPVSELMPNRNKSSSAWFWFSSSVRPSDYMAWLSLSSSPNE